MAWTSPCSPSDPPAVGVVHTRRGTLDAQRPTARVLDRQRLLGHTLAGVGRCAFGGAFGPSACCARCVKAFSTWIRTVALGPVQISPPLNTGPVRAVKQWACV
jgi:hypothetical protein